MATNRRDVNFVIRAKNEASKAFDSINKALDTLDKNQEALGSSSQKLGATLDAFSRIATTVGAAYTKIASESDKAAATFKRQEATLSETRSAYQSLVAQMEAAQRVQRQMASFVGPVRREDAKRIELVNKAYEQLRNQATRLSSSVKTQEKNLQESFYALRQVEATAEQASDALRKAEAAHKAAGDAAEKSAKQQDAEAAAMERATRAAQRRSAIETRRDMRVAASSAQESWRKSQADMKALADEMARSGTQTSDQIARFERLRSVAQSNKVAYRELQMAIAQYNSVLRNQSSSQEQIAAAQERAQSALRGAQSAMSSVARESTRAATGVRQLGSANRQASGETEQLNQAMTRLFSNSRRSLSYFQRLRGEVLALITSYAGLYAAVRGVNNVIDAAITMQTIESRLNVVTGGDPRETAAEMVFVRQEAERLGIALTDLGKEWAQFAVAADASNFGIENARKVFLSVAEAGRVLKMDSQSIRLSFLALTQMMSKGAIQMEELRRQLGDHLPGAFVMMAEAVGVTTAELEDMMKKGELGADNLIKFADVLNRRFGTQLSYSLDTVQAEMGRFSTAVTVALNQIAEAGTLEAFSEALRELQTMLRSDDAKVWFDRIGSAISGVINFLLEVLRNLDYIMAVFVALGTAKGVGYVMALVASFRTLITSIRTAQSVTIGLNASLSMLGGPVGIAIGVASSAFALLATRISETDRAAKGAKRSMDEISEAYRKGARNAGDFAKELKHLTSTELDQQLNALKTKLDDALSGLREPFGRSFMTRARGSPMEPVFREINKLVRQVKVGEMSIADFKKAIERISETHPQMKELTSHLINTAEGAREAETEVRKFEAQLRLMRGEATDADRALLGLVDATNKLSESQNTGAKAMERYSKAMADLTKHIPDLQKAAETEAKLAEVRQVLQKVTDDIYERISAGDIERGVGEQMLRDLSERARQAVEAIQRGVDEAIIKAIPLDNRAIQERIIQIESGGDPLARSSTSSAMGLAQFTEGTWLRLFDRVFPELKSLSEEAKLAMRGTEDASRKMLDVLTRENQAALVRAGITPDARNTYLAHFLGSSKAIEVILANPDELASKIVGEQATKANESILGGGRTVQQLLDWAAQRMGGGAQLQTSGWTEAEVRAAESAQKYNELIKQANEDLDHRIALIGKSELEAQIYNETIAKGIDLHSQEGQAIAEKVTKLWEAEQAAKAGEEAEKRVNDLLALRKELQEQIQFHQDQGNTEVVDRLQEQLDGVNSRLREAIDNAIRFYEVLGGDKAEMALAKLRGIENSIAETGKRTLDAKAINDQFANGAATAFAKVGDAIGAWIEGTMDGKDAIKAIGDAFRQFAADFLRQIAQMIIQQIIFNMVAGGATGGTGGLGGWIKGLFQFHEGGLVGTGGTPRLGHPAWFANAMRYHNGGIAGLRPNEVPAILERGEEVLTRNDPRHVANGGAGQANVKVVNAIDSGSFISHGMNTDVGQQAILNFISANSNAVKSALGVI